MSQRIGSGLRIIVGFVVLWTSSVLIRGQPSDTPPSDQATIRSGPRHQLTSVAFGNGVFVAVGFYRDILVSKDGINWSDRSGTLRISTVGINFTTETYSAGGQSLTLVIPKQDVDAPSVRRNPIPFRGVGFCKDRFVIVGGQGEIYVSSNGDDWRQARVHSCSNLRGVAYGGGVFVAVGDGGAILTSQSATEWTPQASGTTNQLQAVAYGNKTFTVVGGSVDSAFNGNSVI